MHSICILCVAVLLWLPSGASQDDRFGIGLRQWRVNGQGTVLAEGNSVSSGNSEFDSTLDLEGEGVSYGIELIHEATPMARFTLGVWWVGLEETESLDEHLSLDGMAFEAGSMVEREVDLFVFIDDTSVVEALRVQTAAHIWGVR